MQRTALDAPPETAGAVDKVRGNLRSFCATVDGNGNALAGGPVAWRAGPVDIDPIAGILTSVSCASPAFCAAVDTNGRALTWNGSSWSVPPWSAANPADPDGGGLTGVSCPTASFCAAVDGNGNALRWNGATWSAPDRIDADGYTGVSCASTALCAAVAGNGDAVLTKDGGRRWTPVRADPAGGGLTAVSCFTGGCVAVDFAGRALVVAPGRHTRTTPVRASA